MAPAHRFLIEFDPSAFLNIGVRTFFKEDTTTPLEMSSKGLQVQWTTDMKLAHKFGTVVGAQAQADKYIDACGWDARVVSTEGFIISRFRHHDLPTPVADTTEWNAGIEYCARCNRALNADCRCEPIPEPAPPAPEPAPPTRPTIRLRAADAPRR